MNTPPYVAVFPEVRSDDTLCRVHAAGCADIAKDMAKNGGFEDPVDLDLYADDHTANMLTLDPDKLGYEWHDVAVLRCATNAANKARRAAKAAAARAQAEQANAVDKRTAAETPAKPRRSRKAPATPAADPQPATAPRRPRSKPVVESSPELDAMNSDHASETAALRPKTTAVPRRAPKVAATRARRNGHAQIEAKEQADKIIAETTAKVKTTHAHATHAEWDAARLATCDDEVYALAVQVRTARGNGTAWWRIAHDLNLPGSGPSVAQGKTGAAHARRLWARAWGNTYSDTTAPRETKAVKKERALVSPGRPFFPSDTPDAEVIDVVRGREITWTTRLAAGDGVVVSLQGAKVGMDKIEIQMGRKGRVLNFHEIIRDERGTEMVGPRRSVYLERIEKVGA